MSETERMMAKFEVWVITQDVSGLDLEKDEDELGHPYFIDISTQRTFFAFNAGYSTATEENRQSARAAKKYEPL
jgi:hypothetical protein